MQCAVYLVNYVRVVCDVCARCRSLFAHKLLQAITLRRQTQHEFVSSVSASGSGSGSGQGQGQGQDRSACLSPRQLFIITGCIYDEVRCVGHVGNIQFIDVHVVIARTTVFRGCVCECVVFDTAISVCSTLLSLPVSCVSCLL